MTGFRETTAAWAVACVIVLMALGTPVRAVRMARLPRANIAGVSVAGLTMAQARHLVANRLRRKLATKLVVTDGHRAVRQTRRSLGVELDLGWMLGRAAAGHKYVPLR